MWRSLYFELVLKLIKKTFKFSKFNTSEELKMETTIIKNMKPSEIREYLRQKGVTIAGIARDLNKTNTAIALTVKGLTVSDKIRRHIAKCINKPVEDIWPETYLVKDDPTKKGRPTSKGLYA
jgi:lambda repressor-like predicted transcriptional regulator